MIRSFQPILFFCLFLLWGSATSASPGAGCYEGNCLDGYGKYEFANGNRYMGEFLYGKPHGNGILYCANGNKYLGQWVQSWQQGNGKYIFHEGHVYTGEFYRSSFHGNGSMEYANGDRYEGQWKDNSPNGNGTYQFSSGDRYAGQFSGGRFHGEGTFYYTDGSVYTGHWHQSKKHGSGTYSDAGGRVFHGNWVFDRPLEVNRSSETWEQVNSLVNEAAAKEDINVRHTYIPDESTPPKETSEDNASVRVWAVVVGVASYNHMPSLRYTDDDAYQFYAFLKSPEGGALVDEQVKVLVDDNATHDNILQAMEQTFLQADENDVVLFYFSGHGVEGAFVPADFDGIRNRLYHEEIRQILQASKARHKIVLGDACHAGSLLGVGREDANMLASRSLEKMLDKYYKAFDQTGSGTALLLSSKSQEVSLEDSGLRSGVFSYYLIKGLKGAADRDQDRIVTVKEAFDYVSMQVEQYTVGAQTPVLTGHFDGNMPMSVLRF